MYKDGRFVNLQCRRESTGDGERLRRHLKRRKRNWSAGANSIGRARRMHAVEISCVYLLYLALAPNFTWSQPYSFPARPRPTRTYVRTQKKQYTPSSVGLAQAHPNYILAQWQVVYTVHVYLSIIAMLQLHPPWRRSLWLFQIWCTVHLRITISM